MLAEVATSARLTCLVHASPGAPQTARSKPAKQPTQQPDDSQNLVSVARQSAAPANGQKQPKRKQQQREPEEADQAQPRAKQKLKVKGKQRGERAEVHVNVTATTAGAAFCALPLKG
jgi:hypothetical protein